MLYSIEHSPDKVLPEFRSFAESAARTIYSRTKQEIPRDLPWHVRPRGECLYVLNASLNLSLCQCEEFKQGKKIGDGGFSTVFKGMWISRQIEVAIKVFEGLFKTHPSHAV
jgi:serine/threonine protein kinase